MLVLSRKAGIDLSADNFLQKKEHSSREKHRGKVTNRKKGKPSPSSGTNVYYPQKERQ